jgi:hypothetical protein
VINKNEFFPTILSAPKLNQSDIKNNSLFLVPVRTDTKNHSKIEKHAPSDADVKIFVGSGCLSFSVLPLSFLSTLIPMKYLNHPILSFSPALS